MAVLQHLTDDELSDIQTLIPPTRKPAGLEPETLRRSSRKKNLMISSTQQQYFTQHELSACSKQRQLSPAKKSPTKRSPTKRIPRADVTKPVLDEVPILPLKTSITGTSATAANRQASNSAQRSPRTTIEPDSFLASVQKLRVESDRSDAGESVNIRKDKSRGSRSDKVLGRQLEDANVRKPSSKKVGQTQTASRYVLNEARCNEDLVDSDAQDEGEDEDTDLSGFIVDDDAELSYHDSSEEADSEEDRGSRRRQPEKIRSRRRLQRGRRKPDDSEDEAADDKQLTDAFNSLQLHSKQSEHQPTDEIEVIDLTSPEHKMANDLPSRSTTPSKSIGINLFDKFKALRLSPPRSSQPSDIPSKLLPETRSTSAGDLLQTRSQDETAFTTPPATPPRSPSKLKSPSKLLSPSKRGDFASRSPHRQSMDAFWDLNEVNEWNDQFSPKKAPLQSPKKNRFASFDDSLDAEEDSFEAINDSSDSLPSPCESPTKGRSRSISPVKAEKERFLAEKRTKKAEKKAFEDSKEHMATQLVNALDKYITDSRISQLSASTGGVKIIWSKTLRSTAGRANWRRTVTKPTGSPVKSRSEETAPGSTIQHFANIELATKVIDRQDRLISTLAHEFCHLANFMVSGVRDQPHGASFQNWARKVTKWMKSQNEVPAWKNVEVTTKHGYVIEWKYLWVCVGRDQNKAIEFLNINEEDGCGAEYGRHSKSIDTDTQRCGRCKGRLTQVRPKPRASPVKKSSDGVVKKANLRSKRDDKSIGFLEKTVEVVELSD